MPTAPGQVQEQLLRRAAWEQGLQLLKLRGTTRSLYRVLDLDRGIFYGGWDGLTTEEVEAMIHSRNIGQQAS